LAGKRVLVTRAAHQAGKLSEGLRALGAEPVEVPVLEIRPPDSFDAMDAALRNLASYDWLILTSANTVRALTERWTALRIALDQSIRLKVAAVGEATATAARKAGFRVTFVPETYVAESLVAGLMNQVSLAAKRPEMVKGTGFSPYIDQAETTRALAPEGSFATSCPNRRILLARAAVARDVIPDALRAAGAEVDVVDAYQNVLPEAAPEQLRRAVAVGLDAVTFTSSSSVTHLAEAARVAGIAWPLAAVPAVSIGAITSQTLVDLGWEPAAEANPSDIPGLITAVVYVLTPSGASHADSAV
jgi:uroporphyrinogen-III synthase/uroporphyrinogen III methyltransferase/synthase